MRDGIPLLHSNQLRYLLYRSTEHCGLHKFQVAILEKPSSVPTVISHLSHVGNLCNSLFIYLQNINTAIQRIWCSI